MFFQILLLGLISPIEVYSSSQNIPERNITHLNNTTHHTQNRNATHSVNQSTNKSENGKTYFFKYDANTKQFKIYSRVSIEAVRNETIPEKKVRNATVPEKKKKTNRKFERADMDELRKLEAFLDDEWNYSSSHKINKSELPLQIHPFLYNSIIQKASSKQKTNGNLFDVTRISFNKKINSTSDILNFNIGKLEANHSIENAELHFYWSVPEDSEFHKNSCVLRLYEIENSEYAEKQPDTNKLLNVIYISKAQTGWQMFRISKKSIENWAHITEELKLLISVSLANQVNSTSVFSDKKNEARFRTFLMIKMKNQENNEELIDLAPSSNDTITSHRYCSRRNFYVDFQKLHWNNFIIAPEGFMAYDCHGKCTRHNAHNFSNHLKMLTTFENMDEKSRIACCVPTKYFSLPIMFYDKLGNIIIKIYKDLVAAECGCR